MSDTRGFRLAAATSLPPPATAGSFGITAAAAAAAAAVAAATAAVASCAGGAASGRGHSSLDSRVPTVGAAMRPSGTRIGAAHTSRSMHRMSDTGTLVSRGRGAGGRPGELATVAAAGEPPRDAPSGSDGAAPTPTDGSRVYAPLPACACDAATTVPPLLAAGDGKRRCPPTPPPANAAGGGGGRAAVGTSGDVAALCPASMPSEASTVGASVTGTGCGSGAPARAEAAGRWLAAARGAGGRTPAPTPVCPTQPSTRSVTTMTDGSRTLGVAGRSGVAVSGAT